MVNIYENIVLFLNYWFLTGLSFESEDIFLKSLSDCIVVILCLSHLFKSNSSKEILIRKTIIQTNIADAVVFVGKGCLSIEV